MNKRIDNLLQPLKDEFGLYLSISLWVFVFVLFFQPFPLNNIDFNNGLVYVAGFGGIILLTLILIRTLLAWLTREKETEDFKTKLFPPFLNGFLILIISGVVIRVLYPVCRVSRN